MEKQKTTFLKDICGKQIENSRYNSYLIINQIKCKLTIQSKGRDWQNK